MVSWMGRVALRMKYSVSGKRVLVALVVNSLIAGNNDMDAM